MNRLNRGLVVLTGLLLVVPNVQADGTVSLVATQQQVVSYDVGRGAVLVQPVSGAGAEPKFAVRADAAPPVWQLVLQRPDDRWERRQASVCVPTVRRARNSAVLRWRFALEQHGDTFVEVRVVAGRDGAFRWSARVETHAHGWRLRDVHFPAIGGYRADGAVLVQPHGWGVLRPDLLKMGPIYCNYPGIFAAMQFLALQTPAGLVYLGAEDPRAFQKFFVCVPDATSETVTLRINQFPAHDGKPLRRWETPFAAALATVPEATWFAAAARYRDWTTSAPWGRCRLQRGVVPRWLADNDLWVYQHEGLDPSSTDLLVAWKQRFEAPSAVHWYRWQRQPHDVGYPEFFPARPGFSEAVARVQAAGLPVMPYINGRLWDIATLSWQVENASASATVDTQGRVRTEVYDSKIPLAVMCPSTRLWQKTVASLVRRLVHEVGVDGIYIDQIGAADAVRCDATGHPHAPGGGDYWAQGYRRTLRRCRAALGAQQALTTEECADPWNDLVDGFLLVNTRGEMGQIIPLYPAVYGGRTVYFGFQYVAFQELAAGLPLRSKLARSLVWGGQLGWISTDILRPESAREAAFLRDLAVVRGQGRAFLQYGRMLPPPVIHGAEVRSVTTYSAGGFFTEAIPDVVGGLWEAGDGAIALALCNWSDDMRPIRASGPMEFGSPHVFAATDVAPIRRDGNLWCVAVPARAALLLAWDTRERRAKKPFHQTE